MDYGVRVDEAGEYGVVFKSNQGAVRRAPIKLVSGLFLAIFCCLARAIGLTNRLQVYIPTRTCLVLAK